MDIESTLTRLEEVLREEREAIVKFDGNALDRCTDEKLGLLDSLRISPPPSPSETPRYEALRRTLRENLALLSHGRACLREAIATFTVGNPDALGAVRPGLRLHVTG